MFRRRPGRLLNVLCTFNLCVYWERTLSEICEFSILGLEKNWKLGSLGNFLFFFQKHILNFTFLSQFILVVSFRDFQTFDFGYRTKLKTRKPGKFSFFFSKNISWPLRFCLSSFLSILNLNLQHLWKFEVKEHFSRVFDFGYREKVKTRKPQKFSFFLLQAYLDL